MTSKIVFKNTYGLRPTNLIAALGTAVALSAALLLAAPAAASGDAAAGAEKAGTCAACHGMDGNSANPQWPSLAGQNASYLVKTLQAFKDGTRSDVLMGAQAMALNEQDMADLAAHFEALQPTRRTANKALAADGERLYRGGNMETSVSACIACHGPAGKGNAPAGYPAIAGQHSVYTAKQLNDYKTGARKSDGDAEIMRNITERLSNDEIQAVAAYMQGLH